MKFTIRDKTGIYWTRGDGKCFQFSKEAAREELINYLWFESMEMDYKEVEKQTENMSIEEIGKLVDVTIEEVEDVYS